jgi:micrococcal nuclease
MFYEYKAILQRVIDGDTVELTVDCGFKIFHDVTIRLNGVEAPELRDIGGEQAKQRVFDLLDGVSFTVRTYLTRNKTYKKSFTRYIGDIVFDDGSLLSQILNSKE